MGNEILAERIGPGGRDLLPRGGEGVQERIEVRREQAEIVIDVQANAFLHHMVRNIVGSLMEVGAGERPAAWIAEVLAARDRTLAGPTAPSAGLVFVGPLYPPEWGLPDEVTE